MKASGVKFSSRNNSTHITFHTLVRPTSLTTNTKYTSFEHKKIHVMHCI